MISLIFTLFNYTYKNPYLKVIFRIFLEVYLILFINFNRCGNLIKFNKHLTLITLIDQAHKTIHFIPNIYNFIIDD